LELLDAGDFISRKEAAFGILRLDADLKNNKQR
jgi:hypothetical protein